MLLPLLPLIFATAFHNLILILLHFHIFHSIHLEEDLGITELSKTNWLYRTFPIFRAVV
jgi:hypothetical protein